MYCVFCNTDTYIQLPHRAAICIVLKASRLRVREHIAFTPLSPVATVTPSGNTPRSAAAARTAGCEALSAVPLIRARPIRSSAIAGVRPSIHSWWRPGRGTPLARRLAGVERRSRPVTPLLIACGSCRWSSGSATRPVSGRVDFVYTPGPGAPEPLENTCIGIGPATVAPSSGSPGTTLNHSRKGPANARYRPARDHLLDAIRAVVGDRGMLTDPVRHRAV